MEWTVIWGNGEYLRNCLLYKMLRHYISPGEDFFGLVLWNLEMAIMGHRYVCIRLC